MRMPFAAKYDEDLVIEPPDDADVVYGEARGMEGNSTGSGGTDGRPYIRLMDDLKNLTRNSGTEVRIKCEAIGTPPIKFEWMKNHAPVETSRRVKVKSKEKVSRLVISDLEVLDSAYYQCTASNEAGRVNSTALLKVKLHEDRAHGRRPGSSRVNNHRKHLDDDYDYDEEMENPRGRLPHEEDDELYSVPSNAAGPGYAPAGPSERWLDDVKVKEGQCVPYRGEACKSFLAGRSVRIKSKNKEEMYDVDRDLRASMMFINNANNIRPECKRLSHAVACYHMYKVCDPMSEARTQTMCRQDCEKLTNDVCPSEMDLAKKNELVGDGPKAMFPKCEALPSAGTSNCIELLRPPSAIPSAPIDPSDNHPRADHWCYADSGRNYLGTAHMTTSGKPCLRWTEAAGSEFSVMRYEELRHAANYCRNPGGKRPRPWCYASPIGAEEYCDIPVCPTDFLGDAGRGRPGAKDNGSGISGMWLGLGPLGQLGIMGGGVALFILLLILLCCCCRRGKGSSRSSDGKHRSPPTAHSLPTTINSAPQSVVNTAYYRKLNGSSTPMTINRGAEMSSMLSGNRGIYAESEPAPFRVMEIQAAQIQDFCQLGAGQFGETLHEAKWVGAPTGTMQVAVKSSSGNNAAVRATLEEEIRRVASLSHPNVLCLMGVSYLDGGRVLAAIYEFDGRGNLQQICGVRVPTTDHERDANNAEFLAFAIQISAGMEYLAAQSMVHRDLAARNVLICDKHGPPQAKIADFAHMLREHEESYVKMAPRSLLPIRWLAKEALEMGRYSERSDVWAYGITLWEMYSYGRKPYENYTNQQVPQQVSTRQLPEAPAYCPTNMYSLMVECWAEHPDRRPAFGEIHRRLQTWAAISPAHSMLHTGGSGGGRGASSSSHSGSSRGGGPRRGMNGAPPLPGYGPPRGGLPRRPDDSSPLMGERDPAPYEYSDEDDRDSD